MNFLLNIFEKLLTTMSSCTIITIMFNYQALYDNNNPLNKLLMFIWQYTPIVLFPILMIYIAHNTFKSCLSIALYGDKLFYRAKDNAVLLIIFIPAIITIILFFYLFYVWVLCSPLSHLHHKLASVGWVKTQQNCSISQHVGLQPNLHFTQVAHNKKVV